MCPSKESKEKNLIRSTSTPLSYSIDDASDHQYTSDVLNISCPQVSSFLKFYELVDRIMTSDPKFWVGGLKCRFHELSRDSGEVELMVGYDEKFKILERGSQKR